MTDYVVDSFVLDTTEFLGGDGDDLLVTASGSVVEDTNGGYGVVSFANDQFITINGLVDCLNDTYAVYVPSSDTSVFINGTVQSNYVGVLAYNGTDTSVNVGSEGQIEGNNYGVFFSQTTGDSLTNAGSISASLNVANSAAVEIYYGAFGNSSSYDQIDNSGEISGQLGIFNDFSLGQEFVENTGTITGGNGTVAAAIASFADSSVNIVNSGLLTDSSTNALSAAGSETAVLYFDDYGAGGTTSTIDNTGTITGLGYVIQSTWDALNISNSGTIDGGLYGASSVDVINSWIWQGPLLLDGLNNTLTNSPTGTITGAVTFNGGGDIVDNAGKIDGSITLQAGGDEATNAGEIDGAVTFTGAGVTNAFTNTGSITGDFTFSSADSTLSNDGQIYGNVTLADPDTLINTGLIEGNVLLGAGDTFDDSQGGSVTDVITASSGNLFDFSGRFGDEAIANFIAGTDSTHDTIQFAIDDFESLVAVQKAMSQVGPDVIITLDSTDSITLENVNLSTLVTDDFQFVCFVADTMIATPDGEVAIQNLRRGDSVVTTDNRVTTVSWVGRQTVFARFADPLRCLPIRIRGGALADHAPSRDLLVSPDHAILVEGVLIQAGALVNGTSIVRETNVPETFTYYNVELDDHSLILAENAPAETFIDNVDRLAFDNWEEHEVLYPDGKTIVEMPYPRAKARRQVPRAIRERLAERGACLFGASVRAAA